MKYLILLLLFLTLMSFSCGKTSLDPNTYLEISDSSSGVPILQVKGRSSGFTIKKGDRDSLYSYEVSGGGGVRYQADLFIDREGRYFIRVRSKDAVILKDSSDLWQVIPYESDNNEVFLYELKSLDSTRKRNGSE